MLGQHGLVKVQFNSVPIERLPALAQALADGAACDVVAGQGKTIQFAPCECGGAPQHGAEHARCVYSTVSTAIGVTT